jgi:hypothetical protein
MRQISSEGLPSGLLFQQGFPPSTAYHGAFRCVKYSPIHYLSCNDAKSVQNAGLKIGSMPP